MNYEDLKKRVLTTKDREAADQLLDLADRKGDYEMVVYCHLVISDTGWNIRKLFRFFEVDLIQPEEDDAPPQFDPDSEPNADLMFAYQNLVEEGLVWGEGFGCDITKRPVPNLPQDALRKFVADFLAGHIFTSAQVRDTSVLQMVFMVIALGGLDPEKTDLESIGVIYEYMDKAGPRSINGYPVFFSCKLLSRDDWIRAHKAIVREQKRMQEIEV